MRTFVAVSHTVPLEPSFSLDDLAGGAGRLDVLCRYVTASVLISHGIRTDVDIHLVVRDAVTIECRGGELRHLNPDERSTGARLRSALETAQDRAIGPNAVESSPGVYVRRRGLSETLAALATHRPVVLLDESGPVMGVDAVPDDPVFVLSDHRDLTSEEIAKIEELDPARWSLGPVTIHGNHAIAVVHNLCDRAAGHGWRASTERGDSNGNRVSSC